MTQRKIVLLNISAMCACFTCEPQGAAADPVAECIAAHERGLDLRDQEKLLDARDQLAVCAATACPAPIQHACAGLMDEVNAAIPGVVFDVKDALGRDLPDVKLSVDGRPASVAGATPLSLDPGAHTFRFDVSGQSSVVRTLVLREGEHEKREAIVIGQAEKPVTKRLRNDSRTWGWIAGGAGVAGMGTGIVLGLVAKSSYDHAPGCSGRVCAGSTGLDASNSARNLGDVATAVFIAGGVTAAVGAFLWLLSPGADGGERQTSWSVGLTPSGAAAWGRF